MGSRVRYPFTNIIHPKMIALFKLNKTMKLDIQNKDQYKQKLVK